MENIDKKTLIAPALSLFTSFGTLICCAIPALLVSLGMGAVLAGFVSAFPQIVILSKYKLVVFSIAGIMLLFAGLMMWHARNLPCPADKEKAKACARLRKISVIIYFVSVGIFLTGAFFAFIAKYFV